jgi:NAD(P) transhydrogenase subunit beta
MAQATAPFGVHSEVGQLRKVMVCAPGRAHQRLTPSNCDALLFDDVLWVDNAKRDHFDFMQKLRDRGVDVRFGIHPVAGRLPGHMNVLLAEANVPYPQLKEMDEINPEFARADVALVIGANDVTNPAARRPGNDISGMPILDVDQAKSIIVVKRSMGTGYAGMENELYLDPKTSMYFADAKTALTDLTAAVKTFVA